MYNFPFMIFKISVYTNGNTLLKEAPKVERKHENLEDTGKDLYGIDKDISLQSVNFASAENQYLNERTQTESNQEI